jgi:2'-5' RNA ligase
MPLFVVAYPSFSEADRDWLDAVRAVHDAAKHRLVPPHVTLVFGTSAVDAPALEALVAAVARELQPFLTSFPEVRAVRDALSPASHVMLVADEGRDVLHALHDRLYEGPLAPDLRADIPFVPHITVAQCDAFSAAEALAKRLSAERPSLEGSIGWLSVLTVEGNAVVDTRAIALGAAQ